MVKYFLVKVDESFYNANKDALKEYGKKAICVFKVSKLIQENQNLKKQLKISEKSKKVLEEVIEYLKEYQPKITAELNEKKNARKKIVDEIEILTLRKNKLSQILDERIQDKQFDLEVLSRKIESLHCLVLDHINNL